MELQEFIKLFAEQFDETPMDVFVSTTDYKNLEEWNSLTALSVIAMVDDECEKRITGADLRACTTIEELYNLVLSK
ncbi:MAG: acyl carrier protein [Odoribacter splanchnicus]